jgi:glycosidase
MPIFPSPSYHGYDVTDYYSVNSQYGTLADFKHLLSEAHKRGIHVIIDMVLNHTSDEHPWFKASKAINSSYRDWYIWRNADPKYFGPWGEKVWHPSANGYYYGIFESFMPDLNYQNPAVTAEMLKVTKFWLNDIGVDGFRLDAVKHLVENGQQQENSAATHQWLKKEFYPAFKSDKPDAVSVGELSGDNIVTISGYIQDKQLDLAFDFNLANSFLEAANTGQAGSASSEFKINNKIMPSAQYATFLTNHDQNRAMSRLGLSVEKSKVAASLLLTAPGVPFIYYGEEIGMLGTKPDEDIRRPMQWTEDSATAGFTTGKPWRGPDANTSSANVSAENKDTNSLLNHYRALIALRAKHPALQTGSLTLLDANNPGVFASLRINAQETILVLINLSANPATGCKLTLRDSILADGTYAPKSIYGSGELASLPVVNGKFSAYQLLELPPFSTTLVLIKR